ncbi:MAG: sugar phosphate nucleotidyltransferase [Oscillospiraceae bacterium]|nr:sugar phosphate nucleotidyltransferase [Oscillospiraceae bacterium]
MQYSDYIVRATTTINQALTILENNEYKALVLEEEGILYGVLTDGDIRRFLIKNGNRLDFTVEQAATVNPSTVTGYHEQEARTILEQLDCTVVPMLDSSCRIHAIVFHDATLHRNRNEIDNHVIIMAGGYGTRLYPYTEILPKPLLPVGNATITELIIDRFRKFGCRDFSLVLGYKRNLIKSYFSEIPTEYTISYIDEDQPLGTGGGLAFFKGVFEAPVFVTYCDNVIEADYIDILQSHIESASILTMVVARKHTKIPYGVIELDESGAIIGINEKPEYTNLINTGFYVISPEFIDMVEDNEFQHITDIALKLADEGHRIGSYLIDDGCFIDIGQLDDLKEVGNKLR